MSLKKLFKSAEDALFGVAANFTSIIEDKIDKKQSIENLRHKVRESEEKQQIGVNIKEYYNAEAINADTKIKIAVAEGKQAETRMSDLKADMMSRLVNEMDFKKIDPQLITIMQVLIYKKEEGGDILSSQAEYEKLKAEAELIREEVEQQKLETKHMEHNYQQTWKKDTD
jgi:hypothetical protein